MTFANKGQGATQSNRDSTYRTCRGQGATEYLVLLAVVLIIALVAIMLLGYFPGMATDAKITQSQAYWRGQATPFAITESEINSTGYGSFMLQNMEAAGPFTVTSFQVGNYYNNSTNASFSAGESKALVVSGMGSHPGGSVYDLNVTISYTKPSGAPDTQYGTKNIVGKYA
ncbi:MAG: hypothetical protein NTX79_00635 [Candidatus Micrarchaeota archaeon]|nr:hypothetical protein [Candidatus Micrarchaeota archaeon]